MTKLGHGAAYAPFVRPHVRRATICDLKCLESICFVVVVWCNFTFDGKKKDSFCAARVRKIRVGKINQSFVLLKY
jgi:hypothetical protein